MIVSFWGKLGLFSGANLLAGFVSGKVEGSTQHFSHEILGFQRYEAGQIITTSAEVTLNGGLVRESPQNPLNSGLGIILICPDECFYCDVFCSFSKKSMVSKSSKGLNLYM